MRPFGVITGLAREADCFRASPHLEHLSVRCVGGNSARAADTARALVSEGCWGLMSFGIAGGLQPSLKPGVLMVATTVIGPDKSRLQADPAGRRRLLSVLDSCLEVAGTDICGSDRPVLSSKEKRRLHEQTGAVAVDMESHSVAKVAAECKVPFLIVRAIADPADRDIPGWVAGLVGADGRPVLRAIVAGIASHPTHVPALISLGIDSRKAFATLRRVALSVGPFLEFSG